MSAPLTTREYRLPKIDGFHNLTLVEAPIQNLKGTEVLVKVHAVSLQYRDLLVATGGNPVTQKDNVVPGSDMAGEIVALGAEVKGWAFGERVCANLSIDYIFGDITLANMDASLGAPIDGVLTEYKVLPVHSLVRIPEHLSYEEASTLPCAALTAYNALLGPANTLKGGDVVLVLGTGGVSICGLQLAVASGATVIVTSSSDRKLEVAKKLGAAHVINYNTTPDWDKEVLEITGGRGVDRVLELGGAGTILKSINCTRYGGSIDLIGYMAGHADVSSLPLDVLRKGVVMRGILIGSRAQFEDMNRLIGAVKLRPLVDKVFDFERLREAYEYLQGQRHVGKVVVKVSKD